MRELDAEAALFPAAVREGHFASAHVVHVDTFTELHNCPALRNDRLTASATALSMGVSLLTIIGECPPSSMVTRRGQPVPVGPDPGCDNEEAARTLWGWGRRPRRERLSRLGHGLGAEGGDRL